MLNTYEIMETVRMLEEEKLDIRTITMGISLADCADSNGKKAREKIYNKITNYAGDLVKTAAEIELKYDIPIINKRISVTPISLIAAASNDSDYVEFAKVLDKAAKEVGVDFIGGFSALVQKGMTKADKKLINSIPRALSETERVCGSVNIGTTRAGLNMDAIALMGQIVKECAELTAAQGGVAASKLVVFANAPEDNPFMAGAFHGVGEGECMINVGISGPGTVKSALTRVKGESFDQVAETIKKQPLKSQEWVN